MKKRTSPWPSWMGIRGFRFVYHGSWADPEIVWHGHAMNIGYVEDPMWGLYSENCRETSSKESEDGFEAFCKKNVDRMREYAQWAIDEGLARRIHRLRFEHHLFSDDAPSIVAVPA